MRALVLGSGFLRGGFDAGAAAALCRAFGRKHFDRIYMASVGAYAGSFYAADQPDVIEAVWRERVHGTLLVNPLNAIRFKPILDLEYMIRLFKGPEFRLDTQVLLQMSERLCFVVTETRLWEPRYLSPKNEEELFLLLKASSAVPFFHPAVSFKGEEFVDGGLTDALPIERALADGCEEVVVVCNRPRLEVDLGARAYLWALLWRYWRQRDRVSSYYDAYWERVESLIGSEPRVSVIRPQRELPLRWPFDSSRKLLNRIVDLGIEAAMEFVERV